MIVEVRRRRQGRAVGGRHVRRRSLQSAASMNTSWITRRRQIRWLLEAEFRAYAFDVPQVVAHGKIGERQLPPVFSFHHLGVQFLPPSQPPSLLGRPGSLCYCQYKYHDSCTSVLLMESRVS